MVSAAGEPIPPSQTGELAQRYPSHAIKLTEREEEQADVMRPAEQDTPPDDQQPKGGRTSRRRLLGRAAKAAAVTVAVGALLAKEDNGTAHADGMESQTTFTTTDPTIPPVTSENPGGVAGHFVGSVTVDNDLTAGGTLSGTAVSAVSNSGNALFALSLSGGIAVEAQTLDDGLQAVNAFTTNQHQFAILGRNEQNAALDGGGVWGDATNADGTSTNTGVLGTGDEGIGVLGMLGDHVQNPNGGIGVKGTSKLSSGTGVVAENTGGGVALLVSQGSVQVQSPAMGQAKILATKSSVSVSNPVVTANSLIFLTLIDNPGVGVTFWISNRTPSTPSAPGSFTINASKPVMGDATLLFLIIN